MRRIVSLPLQELPPATELERELAERRRDLEARSSAGESRVTTNPVRYHIDWLESQLRQERDGGRATAVDGEIWAARLGDTAVVRRTDGTPVRFVAYRRWVFPTAGTPEPPAPVRESAGQA